MEKKLIPIEEVRDGIIRNRIIDAPSDTSADNPYFKIVIKPRMPATDLFTENGSFRCDNWNSADLRELRKFLSNFGWDEFKSYSFNISSNDAEKDDDTFVMIQISHTIDTDMDDSYYDIILRHRVGHDVLLIDNHYMLKIYKTRGRVELFRCNGAEIKESDYVILMQYMKSFIGI